MVASAAVEDDGENDKYAEGKRWAYTNVLAILLDIYSSEYGPDDGCEKNT